MPRLPKSTLQYHKLTTPPRIFRNLTPRTRLAVGVAFLAWGTAGLYVSDAAEKKLGFEASEKERAALGEVVPRITMVDRDERGRKGER
jgi:hypothetical protein